MTTIEVTAAEAGLLIGGLEAMYSSLTGYEYEPEEQRVIDRQLDLIQPLKDRLLPIYRKEVR
jgi:hypothetical protein